MKPELGDFFVIRSDGWGGRLIRWGTRSNVNHAGLYVGAGLVVEAQPSGATVAPMPDHAVWSDLPLTDLEREAIVRESRRLLGTPYSWIDVVCIGLAKTFGVHVPGPVRRRLARRDELMCSQLVDTAYLNAGIHLYDDGRWPGDVSPSDLLDLILGAKE
jgi:cell wall-associated NlpC family hydrolase